MQTFLIIVGIIAIIAGIYFILIKTGKIGDRDGDFIADDIEDTVDGIKKTIKDVKKRVSNVQDEFEDVLGEISDVLAAIKGKPTKSKLNTLTKKQLIDSAKKDHSVELDSTLKKSTLVNKVYSLYNKK
jgi:Sec-independent protein translocase protein TatA